MNMIPERRASLIHLRARLMNSPLMFLLAWSVALVTLPNNKASAAPLPVDPLEVIARERVTLSWLAGQKQRLQEKTQTSATLTLLDALIDQAKSYAPQALRKLRKGCEMVVSASDDEEARRAQQLSCVFYLEQLNRMGRDADVMSAHQRFSQEPWWIDRSKYLTDLLDAHVDAAHWRLGEGEERRRVLIEARPSEAALDYDERRSFDLRLLRLSYGLSEPRPLELITRLEAWESKYKLYDGDSDYLWVLSFKADLLGAAGDLERRAELLEELSQAESSNLASFPELRLIATLIDLNQPQRCQQLLSRGQARLAQTSEALRLLLHSEQALMSAWCALSLGLPTVAYQITTALEETPQRVGYRYRTPAQWSMMVSGTRFLAAEGSLRLLAALGETVSLSAVRVWYGRRAAQLRFRGALQKLLAARTPMSHPGELMLLPLVFESLLFIPFGNLGDLLNDSYHLEGIRGWLAEWLKVTFHQGPLSSVDQAPSLLWAIFEALTLDRCDQLTAQRPEMLFLTSCAMPSVVIEAGAPSASSRDIAGVTRAHVEISPEGARVERPQGALPPLSLVLVRQPGELDQDLEGRAREAVFASHLVTEELIKLLSSAFDRWEPL